MKNICTVTGCCNYVRSSGSPYCEKHYGRIRRNGSINLKEIPFKHLHTHGYILLYVPEHPLTLRHTGPYEYEHRLVYYDAHREGPFKCNWCGKEVTWEDMHVDHLDDHCDNNSLDNLVSSCPICNQHRGIDKMIRTMRNKCATWIEYGGQRKTVREWASEIGISNVALLWRINRGWPMGRALTERRGKHGPRSAIRSCQG